MTLNKNNSNDGNTLTCVDCLKIMLMDEEERIGEVVLARGCGRDWLKVMDLSPQAGKEYYENRKSIGMVKFVMFVM